MRSELMFLVTPLVVLLLAATQTSPVDSPAAASAPAVAAAPAAPQVVSGDARDVAVAACVTEAKAELTKKGATDVKLKEVEDTDKESNDRAAVRALVNVFTTDKNGKEKKNEKTFKCKTQNGIVTEIKIY